MRDFIYWATGIIATFVVSYLTYKHMKKIKNIHINQEAEKMANVKGADFELMEGEDLYIKDMAINQEAQEMRNVTGLSFEVKGKQSARLQGVTVKQPGSEVVISDNPDVKVEINKQKPKN